MERGYSIAETPGVAPEIFLPGDLLPRGAQPYAEISFGLRRTVAHAHLSQGGETLLSTGLCQALRLPLPGFYRIRSDGKCFVLGPTVGILAGKVPSDITPDRLQAMHNHYLVQGPRGGMFLVFDLESTKVGRGIVEGYRLSPAGEWIAGEWPLPRVVFRRYGIPTGGIASELKDAGVKVFNERTFSKWETWLWLSADRKLAAHVPETTELTGSASVHSLLAKYPVVYLKPNWGSLGSQIVRVEKTDDGFTLNASGADGVFCPDRESLNLVLAWCMPRPGVAQRGLDLATVGGRLVDFRVVTQKDGSGAWHVTGIVGRCGHSGSIVSNMATGGFPMPLDDTLDLLFGTSQAVHFRRREEITLLAEAAGAALDRGGLLLGDLGLDIAYDVSDHPWLIEANNRDPDHNIGWEAGSWPLFYRFRTVPIDYACTLAGFPPLGDVTEDG